MVTTPTPSEEEKVEASIERIIETARILSQYTFDRSIIYANWCAEECGLLGSAAYAADCAAQGMDIVGYFNLDMTGYLEEGSDIHVNLMYRTRNSIIADYVYNFSEVYYPDMRIWQDWLEWGDSDYSSFNRNGYASVHTFEDTHHCSPFIHSNSDLLGVSVNNMDQVKRFTELNLGLVATLAGLVSTSVDETESVDWMVSPNPVSNLLTVKGPALRQIEIYDLVGRLVMSKPVFDGEEGLVEVGSLVPGIYLVRAIGTGGEKRDMKLIKN